MTEKMANFTMEDLNRIVERCREDEYNMHVSFWRGKCHVSLEKGSTYGAMHMKFSADDESLTVAFEKCLANFPRNPVGAAWDTKRLASPVESEEAEFTEIPPSAPSSADDDIPF